jgi:hypothetical protein
MQRASSGRAEVAPLPSIARRPLDSDRPLGFRRGLQQPGALHAASRDLPAPRACTEPPPHAAVSPFSAAQFKA